MTEDQIWHKVRENCICLKTFNPMVAWTYGSAPSFYVNYSNAKIAANHACSILGWQFANSQKFIVLLNPWGNFESVMKGRTATPGLPGMRRTTVLRLVATDFDCHQ